MSVVVADATHYLRTRGHYDSAPIGTIVSQELLKKAFVWKKTSPRLWLSSGGDVASHYEMAWVKRKVERWGSTGWAP